MDTCRFSSWLSSRICSPSPRGASRTDCKGPRSFAPAARCTQRCASESQLSGPDCATPRSFRQASNALRKTRDLSRAVELLTELVRQDTAEPPNPTCRPAAKAHRCARSCASGLRSNLSTSSCRYRGDLALAHFFGGKGHRTSPQQDSSASLARSAPVTALSVPYQDC